MKKPMEMATTTELQKQLEKNIQADMNFNGVIAKTEQEIGKIMPEDRMVSYLTDSLVGVIKENADLDKEKTDCLKKKYDT